MTTKSKTQDKHKMSEIDENISKLFDIKKRLGKGAYGIVWKALDKRTNETLAVKKIFDAFRDETDAQRTFREIIFLKAFRNHPNVVKLNQVYKASNNLDIYLIFEYMESDLHNIIKKGTILKDIHKRYVMYQLINAIKYIHSGNVIHRDLKPSNVLIDSKCRCKLADFGLARSVSNRPMRDGSDMGRDPVVEPLLTDYVATRWYRAPEILVASKRYTKGIDMWSLGCILGEMIRGKPLFQGSSTVNQIEKIVTALPDITERDINAVGAGFGSVLLSKQISTERKTTLDELLADAPDDATSLVKSLLVLDPLSRLNAKQALCHPYVEKFRNSIQEIELKMDILPPFRDDVRLTVPEYRSKLYEIVQVTGSEKQNLPRNAISGKHMTQTKHVTQREPKKESTSYPNHYEKPEILRKSSKLITKQQQILDNSDKCISKEQYLLKTEKYERETQANGQMISNKTTTIKKTSSSPPLPKRKQTKTIKTHPPNEHKETLQITDKLNREVTQPKIKTRYKSTERTDEPLKTFSIEKRHSIDCGYGSLPIGVTKQPSPSITPNINAITLSKVDTANRVYKSSSSLHRSGFTPKTRQTAAKETQVESLIHERQQHRSTPTVMCVDNNNKTHYVRNTKSDLLKSPAKNHERVCYEKRLKKLEEEIEKYKKEVKTFCKESYRYNDQTSDASKVMEQTSNNNALLTQLSSHAKLKQNGIVHKSAVNLPTVLGTSGGTTQTPKKNPYYQLLTKSNRDFEKNDYDMIHHSTGGSGDHIGRSSLEKLSRNNNDTHRLKHENSHRVRPMSKFI